MMRIEHQYAVVCLRQISMLAPELERCDLWLGESEAARLKSITAMPRRRQFLGGRWLARQMASRLLDCASIDIEVVNDHYGAPMLKRMHSEAASLHISLSHSGDWVACAISSDPIGIDLEVPAKARNFSGIAEMICGASERELLSTLPDQEKQSVFYRLWTLKEARGKRDGVGIRPKEAKYWNYIDSTEANADAVTRQSEAMYMAIVGCIGLHTTIDGWPGTETPRYWRSV